MKYAAVKRYARKRSPFAVKLSKSNNLADKDQAWMLEHADIWSIGNVCNMFEDSPGNPDRGVYSRKVSEKKGELKLDSPEGPGRIFRIQIKKK